jgi:aspartate/methionine/tyrosine aminotransferase
MLDLPLSGIKKIEAIAQSSSEYISLSQGALRLGGVPQKIKEHLQEVLKTDKTDYYQSAWGIMPLREKIANSLSVEHSTKLTEKNILITHGCIGALSAFFLTVLNKDDEVIIPEPTYPAYEKLTQVAKGKPVFVSTIQKDKNSFGQVDIENIKKATTPKTKIIVFSNPWNPLGIVVSRKEILDLLDWCEKNKIYLIIDEAYKYYAFDDTYQSCIDLVSKSEFLIVTASFSKNMAMSGWRVGYLVAAEKFIIPVGKVQDAQINCPNVPAQYAALYALDHPEFTQEFCNILEKNLDLTVKMLSPLVKEKIFTFQKPAGTFFMFLKTQFDDAEDLCMNILSKEKVALVPGKFFGPSGDPFARLCFARDEDILQEALSRIVKYFI